MTIIVAAKIANTTVGHIDHAMAYASGFQQLGHEVFVMEHVGSNRCTDLHNQNIPFDQWGGRQHFETVARSYGIWPRCCLIYKNGQATHGLPFADAVRIAKRSDLLMSRSGQIHKVPEIFDAPNCRAYFDGNPGNTQFFSHQQGGDYEALDRYDHFFTLGLNIGTEACPIPTDTRQWHHQVRPVVLNNWPLASKKYSKRFTTISTWKGRSTFEFDGKGSGEKSDNWLRFLDLPQKSRQEFEIALRIDSANHHTDREMFEKKGWRLTNPALLKNIHDYRNYIGQSRAEFSVAHNRYVEFSTGWFSDRSPLYLASGKPVLVQSTGIEAHLPTGKGLLTYATMEEAIAGVETINRDYAVHCQAARKIAEEFFDSKKVLNTILKTIAS